MSEYSVVVLFGLALVARSSSVANKSLTVYSVTTILDAIYGEQMGTFTVRSMLDCIWMCSNAASCRSVLFDSDRKLCSTNRCTMDPTTIVPCGPNDGRPISSVRRYAKKNLKTTMRQNCCHDNDCVDPMSECRLGNCACVPGYSYNRTAYSCVTGCTEYGTKFQLKLDKDLKDLNDYHYAAPSFEHCADTCIAATSFVCRSIEYLPDQVDGSNCFLSTITAVTRPDVYVDSPKVDLYTRDCL